LYVNGVLGNSVADSKNYTAQAIKIGAEGSGSALFPGYISNLRIVKGVAVYTAAFTPPTQPFGTTQSANVNGVPSAAITGTQTSLLT
jgi:hypothetical protein